MIAITNLSSKELHQIASLKGKIESIQQRLSRILGAPPQAGDGATPRKRRKMSTSARAKIAAAARARWKKAKAAGKNTL